MNTAPDPQKILERLRPSFSSLEAERLGLLAKRKTGTAWILGIIGGGILLAFALAYTQSMAPLFVLFFTVVGVIICYFVFFNSSKQAYNQSFKSKVVAEVAAALAPGISFKPSQHVSKEWFQSSSLFSRPDRYTGEDYFVGKIGKTDLFFSEVHAEQKHTHTDSKGNTRTSYSTIFRGIFLVADFNKEFRTRVKVAPDALDSFGFLGKKLQGLGGTVQRMENVEFERLFVVRSPDPVEARYILTPAMQERFIELSRKWSPKLRVSFQDSLVILALPLSGDWFEGNIHTPVADPSQFNNLVAQLNACFSTVTDLDLNTRIWTKE